MLRRTFFSAPLSLPAARFALSAPPRRPNVVILLADDLGWRDVGFNSSEIRTPHLDRLAAEGQHFERFYSCPVCSPTRAALMTGRSPMRLGVQYTVIRPWSSYGLPLNEHLLPQTFKAAGYQTAMAGKWHLGHADIRFFPGARGFDHSYGHFNGAIDYWTHIRDGGVDWHRDGRTLREQGYSTDLIGAEAVRRIRERDRSRPFFLYVPFNAPHAPLQAPPALIEKYAHIADERRRTFAAMVEALDLQAGRILDTLRTEGIDRQTIVLFFSDNGGPTNLGASNTPFRGAKGTTFEGGLRVPAVLSWPGVLAPGTSRQVMTAMDVFPTLAAAAGLTPQGSLPLDGRNLWPQLTSGRAAPREDLFFAVENGARIHFAVHHGPWKLVRETGGDREVNSLFRIEEDPGETRDLAPREPQLVKDLVARIERWRSLHPPDGVRFSNNPPPGWRNPPQWAEAARR